MKKHLERQSKDAYEVNQENGEWFPVFEKTKDITAKETKDVFFYTDEDIEKAYKSGQSGKTFYRKDGTVILPDNYQGIDG